VHYTLKNNSAAYFTIDGNTLQLAKTVDYETTKTLSITIRVADANGHAFGKDFNFTIIDIDDTAPTDIAQTNNSIAFVKARAVLMLLVAVMARVIGNVSVISVALIFSCS
jgi:hypothetical protein